MDFIFSVLNMNPKIGNFVVKNIDDGKIDFFHWQKCIEKKMFRPKTETFERRASNVHLHTFSFVELRC
jgi:hypothetical protein